MSSIRILLPCLLLLASWSAAAEEPSPQVSEILARAQEAAGGVDKLAAVDDLILIRQINAVSGGLSARQTVKIVLPDALRQESALPFGTLIVSLVDGEGHMQSMQGSGPLPPPQLAQARGELFRVREALLLADRNPELNVTFAESVEVDGRTADVLEVANGKTSDKARLYIDVESGEFFRLRYQGVAVQGQGQSLEDRYSDFREIEGVRVPFHTEVHADGKLLTKVRVEKAHYNSGLTKAELR